jgi:hypothetical protein
MTACAALLISSVAEAAKIVAVLPLDVSHARKKLDAAAQASLEEMLRDVATNALTSSGWIVLTGETTLQVLLDNGVDAAKCGDQSCHLSMAREIKAEKFLSGAVQYVEGSFTASIRLIDTGTGRILASQRVEGETVRALRKSFEEHANEFFARGGMLDATPTPAPQVARPPPGRSNEPTITSRAPTAVVGNLTVSAKPKDLVRLELTPPSGTPVVSGSPYRNASAEPGRWKVTASAEGYAEETREFTVPPDEESLEKFELKPLGGLSITGTPEGAAVTVTGPNFRHSGSLPWEAKGLRSGTYHVTVSRAGYATFERDAEVPAGDTQRVAVRLEKAAAVTTATYMPSGSSSLPPLDRSAIDRALNTSCGSDNTACYVLKACKGAAKDCFSLASAFSNGSFGLPKDPALAAVVYEYGCSGNDLNACAMASMAWQNATGVPKDLTRARQLARHACQAGSALCCWNIQTSLDADNELQKEADAALRRGCDGGDPYACWYGYSGARFGWSAHAADLIRKQCAGGRAEACSFEKSLK